jgi:hemolysin III
MYKGEKINSITHLVGAALALPAVIVLIVMAFSIGDTVKIVSISIYGFTLFILYLFSTLYHSFRGTAKTVFQRFDHIGIFLLIAGTYTPFTLITLHGLWGWSIFGFVWGLAVFGITMVAIFGERVSWLRLILYVVMGWCIVVAMKPLTDSMNSSGLAWLMAGGLFYTVGIIFYAWKGLPRGHEIWHFFVLAGSLCHFITISLYVL